MMNELIHYKRCSINKFGVSFIFRINWWLPPMPFALLIFVYDETRKWWLRNHPGGVIERETYY